MLGKADVCNGIFVGTNGHVGDEIAIGLGLEHDERCWFGIVIVTLVADRDDQLHAFELDPASLVDYAASHFLRPVREGCDIGSVRHLTRADRDSDLWVLLRES